MDQDLEEEDLNDILEEILESSKLEYIPCLHGRIDGDLPLYLRTIVENFLTKHGLEYDSKINSVVLDYSKILSKQLNQKNLLLLMFDYLSESIDENYSK